MITTIWREFQFDAAHYHPTAPKDMGLSEMHGHSYRVRVFWQGDEDAQLGWVHSFEQLDAILSQFKAMLDHKTLNDIPGLEMPMSEHLAKWLYDGLGRTVFPPTAVEVYRHIGGMEAGARYQPDAD